MVTAIFPVNISSNAFWSSPQGLSCTEKFIRMVGGIQGIDHGIVVTKDPDISLIAKQYGLEIEHNVPCETVNGPRSFEEIVSLGQRFEKICPHSLDAVLLIDHRNLLLTAHDIYRAFRIREQASGAGVISLKYCRDYPCQYRSYSTFLGTATFHFKSQDMKAEGPGSIQVHPHSVILKRDGYGKITVTANPDGRSCRLSLSTQNPAPDNIMVCIIPFDNHGPKYDLCQEILLFSPFFEMKSELDIGTHSGIILNLTIPSVSGEYDTVKCFSPPNAPWELSLSGSEIRVKESRVAMQGRQQFPMAYEFDGSLCFLEKARLLGAATPSPMPFLLGDACIVSDWVDYWYTATVSSA